MEGREFKRLARRKLQYKWEIKQWLQLKKELGNVLYLVSQGSHSANTEIDQVASEICSTTNRRNVESEMIIGQTDIQNKNFKDEVGIIIIFSKYQQIV